MTPKEAHEKYRAEWPILRANLELVKSRGDAKEAKKCRQMLSSLSDKYKLRFEDEDIDTVCPYCGQPTP